MRQAVYPGQTSRPWIRSIDDLRTQVLAFIDYFNRTMAKPFKWTYQEKPLHA
jgi:hypothetical protein